MAHNMGSPEWWADLPEILQLTGVPVVFVPRESHNGRKIRKEAATFAGDHAYALPLLGAQASYPGEILLRPRDPQRSLLFGCATVASGDVQINGPIVLAMLQKGCHE